MTDKTQHEVAMHVEAADGRRGSTVATPQHNDKAVWEQRETYGPAGFKGIFTSRYVFAAAAFATLGGTLFGYE